MELWAFSMEKKSTKHTLNGSLTEKWKGPFVKTNSAHLNVYRSTLYWHVRLQYLKGLKKEVQGEIPFLTEMLADFNIEVSFHFGLIKRVKHELNDKFLLLYLGLEQHYIMLQLINYTRNFMPLRFVQYQEIFIYLFFF